MTKKKPTAFEIANTCNACGKQMERGAVMVCHACAGKSQIHPTPLKIGETIRWKKNGDIVLEKPESAAPIDQRTAAVILNLRAKLARAAFRVEANENGSVTIADEQGCALRVLLRGERWDA